VILLPDTGSVITSHSWEAESKSHTSMCYNQLYGKQAILLSMAFINRQIKTVH